MAYSTTSINVDDALPALPKPLLVAVIGTFGCDDDGFGDVSVFDGGGGGTGGK